VLARPAARVTEAPPATWAEIADKFSLLTLGTFADRRHPAGRRARLGPDSLPLQRQPPLRKQMKTMPSRDPDDPAYRRLCYCRYAEPGIMPSVVVKVLVSVVARARCSA